MNSRPSSDKVLLQYAFLLAERSTCERGHVGCVIARNGRPISVGYNGAPPGQPHCLDVGCDTAITVDDKSEGCKRAIHAEMNAVAWAARLGLSVADCTVYCTHAPCKACAQALTAAGVASVYYVRPYRAARLDILTDSGIFVAQIDTETMA